MTENNSNKDEILDHLLPRSIENPSEIIIAQLPVYNDFLAKYLVVNGITKTLSSFSSKNPFQNSLPSTRSSLKLAAKEDKLGQTIKKLKGSESFAFKKCFS